MEAIATANIVALMKEVAITAARGRVKPHDKPVLAEALYDIRLLLCGLQTVDMEQKMANFGCVCLDRKRFSSASFEEPQLRRR